METPKPSRLPIVAFTEWLMVLPAAVFIAAAILRSLQPSQYEPARTSSAIVNWAAAHVTRLDAAILFLGLPALAAIIGCAVLMRMWHSDEDLRQDLTAMADTIRRHTATVLLTAATAVAGAIFVFSVIHVLTD